MISVLLTRWKSSVWREFCCSWLTYSILFVLLLGAFFVRVYNIHETLGFWFDQGRDALVIWRLFHEGKFFLIGPTTGIEGIFRGPWYYWLIAPFYLMGGGDPVWPSVFLSFTTVAALFVLFLLARQIGGNIAGFLAVLIGGFSYQLLRASRWLSNPTPMLLISVLFLYSLFLIVDGKRWAWVLVGLFLGMSMQFGSAAELFYFPAVLVFAVWQRRSLPGLKILLASFAVFFVTFVPQLVFDFRHDGILRAAIARFLFAEGSFQISVWEVVVGRVQFYYDVFFSKILHENSDVRVVLFFLAIFGLFVFRKRLWRDKKFLTAILVFVAPLFGMVFYQGNYGNVYDYYFTGYYLVFILIFSVVLACFARYAIGKVVILAFIVFFIQGNYQLVKGYLDAGLGIVLGTQLEVVEWVFADARGQDFNVDVYVPPVVPYAWDYLFLWQANEKCGGDLCGMKLDRRVPLLYTVQESDPGHPERVGAWRARQEGVASVEESVEIGGILIERRTRLSY